MGSGPNGLTAAVVLAREGVRVTVHEAETTVGGAARSAGTLGDGTVVDLGSAVHPFGIASPVLRSLGLERHGLQWRHAPVPLAHPLDDRPAALLHRDLLRTAIGLGRDGSSWRRLHEPFVRRWDDLVRSVLSPLLRRPAHPLLMAGFGAAGVASASVLTRTVFRDEPARALFAGSATHAVLPLGAPLTSAFGVLFGTAGMTTGWPVPHGGAQAVSDALVAELLDHGGRVLTGHRVTDLAELGEADLVLLDLTPQQVLRLRGTGLPPRYRRALQRWRYGPGAFKVDYLLDGPVPWTDPQVAHASSVHVGGTATEVATAEAEVHRGRHPARPFVLLAQQDVADPGRAPDDQRVVWAYTHVPNGSDVDVSDHITAQVERFAPGFRDRVVDRLVSSPARLQAMDANLVGGDVNGGAFTGLQQVARPVLSNNPYRTPVPGLYLCSASTPPGGGVHGMCGAHAAAAALRWLDTATTTTTTTTTTTSRRLDARASTPDRSRGL
ncbi:phytoene desaturase family protein [Aquipuribacter sp. MA13-6]|uniref:phytoene desaturase family protein n=1 Tax=unclassified Aquipuribacter TaxID=2635084 RepID=UPI003EEACC6D